MDITRAESALIGSKTKYEMWRQKAEAEWMMPIAIGYYRMLWDSMPEDVKGRLKEMDNESYEFFKEMVGGE